MEFNAVSRNFIGKPVLFRDSLSKIQTYAQINTTYAVKHVQYNIFPSQSVDFHDNRLTQRTLSNYNVSNLNVAYRKPGALGYTHGGLFPDSIYIFDVYYTIRIAYIIWIFNF